MKNYREELQKYVINLKITKIMFKGQNKKDQIQNKKDQIQTKRDQIQ